MEKIVGSNLKDAIKDRVKYFHQMEASWDTWHNQKEPDKERGLYNYIGTSGGKDTGDKPIPAEHFTMGVVQIAPGRYPSIHTHSTEEVFMPLTGEWELELTLDGQEENVYLGRWDCISVPAGVFRRFRNVGTEEAFMLVMMGSDDPRITSASDVKEENIPTNIDLKEVVKERVKHFKKIKPSWETWSNQKEPGLERILYKYIGQSGGQEAGIKAIPAENFTMGAVSMPPGNKPGLHTHSTEEVFFPLTGNWVMELGDHGEEKVYLNKWDCISVPAGVMRQFVNIGTEESLMLVMMGSDNPLITKASDMK